MIDVQPSAPRLPASQSSAPLPATQNTPAKEAQQPAEQPQQIHRPIEKLSTDESEAIRRDPAILELLKVFKGEINMITKDAPTADETVTPDRPTATAVEIHIDQDDEEELA